MSRIMCLFTLVAYLMHIDRLAENDQVVPGLVCELERKLTAGDICNETNNI